MSTRRSGGLWGTFQINRKWQTTHAACSESIKFTIFTTKIKFRSDARRRTRGRVAKGLEPAGRSRIAAWRPDRTRRLGPARRVPESALWIARARRRVTVGWRPDSDSERVRGWSSSWLRRQRLGPRTRGNLGWADGVLPALCR